MRAAVVVLTLTLLGAESQVLSGQSLPADAGPGRIAWFDLSTTDLARSKAFYGQLFGWGFTPVQGTDQAAEIVAGGTPIGTLRAADGSISVFNGVVYVQVSDLRASCEQAKALGGTVAPGFPFDLPGGIGAIALVVDPGGHPIGLYSRTPLATGRPRAQ